jgi:hypothetical protein
LAGSQWPIGDKNVFAVDPEANSTAHVFPNSAEAEIKGHENPFRGPRRKVTDDSVDSPSSGPQLPAVRPDLLGLIPNLV